MKEKYIRIGTQLYKVVLRPLISGDFIEEKVQWSYETLRQDYGKNNLPEIRRLLEEGAVQATVGQQPYRQGADAMKTLLARLLFQTVPAAPCLYMEDEIKVKYNL